jgi:hypothetical protein
MTARPSSHLREYAAFLRTFSARLAAHSLRLSVAAPNGNLVNTSGIAVGKGGAPGTVMNASVYRAVGHSGAEVSTMDTCYAGRVCS